LRHDFLTSLKGDTPWASHIRWHCVTALLRLSRKATAIGTPPAFPSFVAFRQQFGDLKRETGSLAPRRQGHLGGGKLTAHGDWVYQRLAENGVLTLNELCVALAGRGVFNPELLATAARIRYEGYLRREDTNAAILELQEPQHSGPEG
jgi:hypothetical protein